MNYLLDTCILVDYFREKEKAKDLLLELLPKGKISISGVTYGELFYGTWKASDPKKEQKKLLEFLDDFNCKVLSLEEAGFEVYAKAKHDLEKKGIRLDEFDLLIGASAVVARQALVTFNKKHFVRFPGLELYLFSS